MQQSGNTILITGGSTGIGLALATRFLSEQNEVIICGRRQSKLDEAKVANPRLHTFQCDIAVESERIDLFGKVTCDFPSLNVLFSNAGISNSHNLESPDEWPSERAMIETNLAAPIHLSQIFAGHLSIQQDPAVLITTSGLAYVPRSNFPIYCATKAALHSFTLSLRHQFKTKGIEVIEICPPHVDTDLGAPGKNKAGVNLQVYADAVMGSLKSGEQEITYGTSTEWAAATREERNNIFAAING